MIIKFDHNGYCASVAQNVFFAVQDTVLKMEAAVGSIISTIEMNPLDKKQRRSPDGVSSALKSHVATYDKTMRQGGRITGHIMTGDTKASVVALFYEYGTGAHSEMPAGRFKHLEPNRLYREGMIVGRPTQSEIPRGRRAKGETYRVISYGAGELTHTTRGRKAGIRLPSLEVPAYHFMREGVYSKVPELKSGIIEAIKRTPVKPFFTFKSVRKR